MSDSSPKSGVRVTPAVLKTARLRVGLSENEAVPIVNRYLERHHHVPIDVAVLQAFESGQDEPTVAEAEGLARAYVIPYAGLFQERLQQLPLRDFRRLSAAQRGRLSRPTLRKLATFGQLYDLARLLSAEFGLAEQVHLPVARPEDISVPSQLRTFASELRFDLGITLDQQESWESDVAALTEWTKAMESLGPFVFRLPMDVREVRAASRWDRGSPPAILLNSSDEVTARIFSLLHEVGHLIMSGNGGSLCDPSQKAGRLEERLANRLAAETLVPAEALLAALPTSAPSGSYKLWPSQVRKRLQQTFNVSNTMLGIRLRELDVVKDSGYRPMWRETTGFGSGKGRPARWRSYRGYMGARVHGWVKTALDSERISSPELARLLDLKVTDIEFLTESA